MRVCRTISGPVWRVILEGHSGLILDPYLDPFWTLSEKPHELTRKALHLAVGRAFNLKYTNIGVLEVPGWVPGIAPPGTRPAPYPGYTLLPLLLGPASAARSVSQTKYGRGALIGSPTHFRRPFLRVHGYDRGL